MSDSQKPKKKVVQAQSTPKSASSTTTKKKSANTEITWQASPEQKAKARNFRIIAFILWLAALGLEFWVIYKEFQKPEINTWLVVGLIVVIGALAITGSLLWRKSNKIDPASEKDKVRFFVQNQLGAFIAALAFLPLLYFVFTNKNMDTKQKGIIGVVAVLMFGGAFYTGVETNAASQEQYSQDKNLVLHLNGKDEVYWTAGGGVYHLCEAVSDLQRESQSNEIVVGTIEQAQDAGKHRLTKKVATEARQCGIDESVYTSAIEQWEAGTLGAPGSTATTPVDPEETSDETTDDGATDESTEETEDTEE
ncbi:hypothetical protein ACFSYH_10750 [Populibacterium corticicola]|uniref:Uncharacterized protein n=1 Tax=Populibacterium corticicola TaxID=1812826 RepID=A0ABW5XEY8_9MICO